MLWLINKLKNKYLPFNQLPFSSPKNNLNISIIILAGNNRMKQQKKNRLLSLVLGEKTVEKLARVKVLLVGAGGIGCEVIKNISRLAITQVTVLDFDQIEQTNLNRQFYFRKQHVSQAKSHTLKKQILKLAPHLEFISICENLYNQKFNDRFYMQFDVLISALDNLKAREHLAAQATRNNKPLIDAGTMSYNGQAYASIRFLTSCHNCYQNKHEEQAEGVCLIRSRPERPIHCATYAKNFYQAFFAADSQQTMSDRLKPERFLDKMSKDSSEQNLQDIACKLFTQLFDEGITDVDMQGNKIQVVRKLRIDEALISQQILKNPQSTLNKQEFEKQRNSAYRQEKLWSLKEYAEGFINSTVKLLRRKFQFTLPCQFEKDDEDCMMLVYCMTNLRTFNFINWNSPHNQHQFITYYRCKDIAGRVMPAIASTNAIAAALELRQLINVITQSTEKLRLIHFSNNNEERLSPCLQSGPNISCQFCSERVIYAKVRLNMNRVLFSEFQDFAKQQLFSFGRDLYSGSFVLIRNSRKGVAPNKMKPIAYMEDMIKDGVLPVSFRSLLVGTPVTVHISIFHDEGIEGICTLGTQTKQQMRRQLWVYYSKIHEERVDNIAEEIRYFGGYQL